MTLASAWIHLLVIDLFAARFFFLSMLTRLLLGLNMFLVPEKKKFCF
jgi:hypothetical protein